MTVDIQRVAEGQYALQLSEEMLMFVERGILHTYEELVASVRAHKDCDLSSETGCKLSQAQLIKSHGSLAAAQHENIYPVDCSEDLAWLYSAMSQQMSLLYQSRYLRTVRDVPRALPSRPTKTAVATSKVETILGLKEEHPMVFDEKTGTHTPVDSVLTRTGTIPKITDSFPEDDVLGADAHPQKEEKPPAVDDYEPPKAEEERNGPQHRLKGKQK